MEDKVVKKVGDYYITNELLGNRYFSDVYLGYKGNPDNKVAIKMINRSYFWLSEKTGEIFSDIELLTDLRQENIISLIAVLKANRSHYFIMDLCSNGGLFDYLKNKPRTPELVLRYTKEILAGFRYLYENNINHKRFKPTNLLVDSNGTLKIAGFGFYELFYTMIEGMSELYSHLKVNFYSSLELISEKNTSSKCDFYSVAVVLFELAYGHHPMFPPSPAPRLMRDLRRRFKKQEE